MVKIYKLRLLFNLSPQKLIKYTEETEQDIYLFKRAEMLPGPAFIC